MKQVKTEKVVASKSTATCPVCDETVEQAVFFDHMEEKHPELHHNGPKLYTDEEGKGVLTYESTPPKYVVEAVFVDALKEMAATLEVTAHSEAKKLGQVPSFVAAMAIWFAELSQLNDIMKDTQMVTLTTKHKLIAEVLPLWLFRIEVLRANVELDMTEDNQTVVGAAREMVSIIQMFHHLLDEELDKKTKRAIVKEYKAGVEHISEEA